MAAMARRRGVRGRPLAVPPHAQGSRAQLVGDAGSARPAHLGDERRLQPRAASDVFGVLAVGGGAGLAATELDRRAGRPDRLRHAVLSARRARGGADDRDLRRRVPPLYGPELAPLARHLLASGCAEALARQLLRIQRASARGRCLPHAWASAFAALREPVSCSILCACATAWRAASLWVNSSSFSV